MSGFLYEGGSNWSAEVSKLRKMGAALPYSPTQARAEAINMRESVNNRSLIASMNRNRLNNYRGRQFLGGQGSNMQIALPKVRQPLGSLADKGIPYNVEDEEELKDIRRWCNTPDAPVWMADYTFKEIGDINPGDQVIGWTTDETKFGSGRRQLVPSTVLAVNRRQAPEVVRITFESGRTVQCTPDHEWLRYYIPGKDGKCYGGKTADSDYAPLELGGVARHVITPTTPLTDPKQIEAAFYLAGIIDGEGSWKDRTITVCQSEVKTPAISARIEESLNILGLEYVKAMSHPGGSRLGSDVTTWTLRSSTGKTRQAIVDLYNWTHPEKMTQERMNAALLSKNFGEPDQVVSIESLGPGEVVSMQTTTGNYTAWGFASKNCRLFYATHDLVPLLIDIYSKFPVVGLEFDSKDPLIKRFYEEMFLGELNYLEFLPDQLGREYFTTGEVTSLAHFNESLGVWSSEEILNPDMLRVSRSLFVQRDRVQLLVKDMVESLRQGPDGGAGLSNTDETPSERLQRNQEYCCTPETKVLTADLRWVPVKSLVVGDSIMGFDEYARPGKKKREWVPTRVTATNVITGNTYRIVADGLSVECTDQHRWLAMPQNRWETLPIDTTRDEEFYPSYEWRGKEVKRTKPWVRRPCHHCGIPMELRPSAAAVTRFCSKTCSDTIKNRSYSSGKNSGKLMWLRADEMRIGDKIMCLGLWNTDDSRDAGWMGGFLDGEGTLGSCGITFSQNVGPVLDRALAILDAHKFSYSLREGKPHANTGKVCSAVRINGGWPETLRALSVFRPVRLLKILPDKIHGKEISGDWVTVTEVVHVGDQDVIALATSSKTLIAEGMFSHNTDLVKYYPEIIEAAAQNDGLDISDALISRIVNRPSPWAKRGAPHLLRSFRTLMTEESLMAAQDAVADRLYSPLVLATLGIEDMGDGEPWIPDQSELDDARDDLQSALAADFRLMVHNFGLKVENVFGRESVPNLDADFDRVQAKLLQAWGIGAALISGGDGGAYASSALNREFVTQMMVGFQNALRRHIIKRAEVIAEAQGHYDYDLKGGTRVPIYREIVETDPETGEEYIRKVPKLLIPEVKFSVLNLRDEAQERAFISQLKAMGVPVSDKTLAVNIDMEFDQELERQAEESVAKLMATAQAMKKVQDLCDAQNLPYPPELAQHLMSTLQLRQGKTQTELGEAQAVAGEAQAELQADQIEMQKTMLEQQMMGAGMSPAGGGAPGDPPLPPGAGGEEEGAEMGAGPNGAPIEGPAQGPNVTPPSADGPAAPGPGNPSAGYYATASVKNAGLNNINGPHGSPPFGSPPSGGMGPELPPGVPEPSEIPRNRQRPVESDTMRSNTPKQVGAGRIQGGPSSYGKSLKASEEDVKNQVKRLQTVANWDFSVARHPKVADLVMDPKFYRALNMQTYKGQLQADWPEILNGGAKDSKKILEDMLAQFFEIFGVEPEW